MRPAYLRLAQLISGGVIFVLLGIHMLVNHLNDILRFFGAETVDPTAWESMIGRSRQGVWAGVYITLLIFALFHGLYGLRDIILELNPSRRTERIIIGALITVGAVFLAGGSFVPIALLSR